MQKRSGEGLIFSTSPLAVSQAWNQEQEQSPETAEKDMQGAEWHVFFSSFGVCCS